MGQQTGLNEYLAAEGLPFATFQELVDAAMHDPLTELYNRGTAIRLFEREYSRGQEVTFLLLDIDNFKSINDKGGHQMGDAALLYLAELLRRNFQGKSIVFRLGGDEFGVVLKSCEEQTALKKRMDELCRRYKESVDGLWPGHDTSLSYGGIIYHSPLDFDSAYRQADEALYEAKNRGKDNGVIRVLS